MGDVVSVERKKKVRLTFDHPEVPYSARGFGQSTTA